jgi:hypothetical protein
MISVAVIGLAARRHFLVSPAVGMCAKLETAVPKQRMLQFFAIWSTIAERFHETVEVDLV